MSYQKQTTKQALAGLFLNQESKNMKIKAESTKNISFHFPWNDFCWKKYFSAPHVNYDIKWNNKLFNVYKPFLKCRPCLSSLMAYCLISSFKVNLVFTLKSVKLQYIFIIMLLLGVLDALRGSSSSFIDWILSMKFYDDLSIECMFMIM